MVDRRGFLAGALVGAAGAGIAGFGPRLWRRSMNLHSRQSYSQMGEDLVLFDLLREAMGIDRPTYVDVGAADPIQASNTYLLHENGGRGVLVEPNPAFQERLRRYRPRDVVVAAGVGVTDEPAADYYVIRDAPMRNTFSKDEVEYLRRRAGRDVVETVLKMPLVPLNRIIGEHLGGAPDLLSTDVEGLDFAILQTLDFEKYRPAVIITEAQPQGPIPTLLSSKGYEMRGATMFNVLFADPARYVRS